MRVLFSLVLLCRVGLAAPPAGCEASPSTREILNRLAAPPDPREPAAARAARTVEVLRKALVPTPRDTFLHEAYQDAVIGRIGDERDKVIDEYGTLLAKTTDDPVFLYLAARAEFGWKTALAIAQLKKAIRLAPEFAPAHLLFARIDSSEAFDNPKEAALHLDLFFRAVPSERPRVPRVAMEQRSGTYCTNRSACPQSA